MTKKILINENRDLAIKHIETLKAQARGISDLIQVFNNLGVLNKITGREQVQEFLKDPTAFLNNAVLKDTGITFSTKAKPLPEQVAAIFGIPYESFINQLNRTRIGNLEHMKFNEDTLSIEFDPDSEKAIYEDFKEYARSEDESKEIQKDRDLCKILNERVERYGFQPSDMNLIADRIGLKCEVKSGGHGYELKENIAFIRHHLEYESIHGKD